ncbi:MAG: hypothetical protein AVDCRST_MAG55-3176, partial [uncultured Rubrobacteraceae bacterium]
EETAVVGLGCGSGVHGGRAVAGHPKVHEDQSDV